MWSYRRIEILFFWRRHGRKKTLSIRWVDGSTIVEWLIETAVSQPMKAESFAQTELLTLLLRHSFYRRNLGVIVTER